MRRVSTVLAATALLLLTGRAVPGKGKMGLDEEGFITTWLLLAPIVLDKGQSGADALGKEQIPGEAKLRPKAGDKVKFNGKKLVWKVYQAKGYFFEVNDFLGKVTEDSVAYAVCYIHADRALPDIQLRTGSDDQAVVYLNGKQVLKQAEDRELTKDDDITDVSLQKGVNVLMFKVVNEKEDWSGCARFTDKNGQVIKKLKVTSARE